MDMINEVKQNPNKALLLYAHVDVESDKAFFVRKGTFLLLDAVQLSRGLNQQGGLGITRPPLEEWLASGKIHLSLVDIKINTVSKDLLSFIRHHYGNEPLIGAEVGVFHGDNALRLLENLNIKRLYLIDPYESNSSLPSEDYWLSKTAREIAYKRLEPYSDRIIWIDKCSEEAVNDISDKLHFCYLDSAHSRSVVAVELPLYYDLVRENGIYAGHDYGNRLEYASAREHIEVHSCVDEFIIERQIPHFYYSPNHLQWFIIKNGIENLMQLNNCSNSSIGIGEVLLLPGETKSIIITPSLSVGIKRLVDKGSLKVVKVSYLENGNHATKT